MLLIDQNGQELPILHPEQMTVKLQPIGEFDHYNRQMCGIVLMTEDASPPPYPIALYRSHHAAQVIGNELTQALRSDQTFFTMPPSDVTALELMRRLIVKPNDEH